MANIKINPKQKVVTIHKEKCDEKNLYAKINLGAMEEAAQDLDAGAFKLWIYFAKNQNEYTFALSSSDVNTTFGMKIKQYNNAVEELINKGYLVLESGSTKYSFHEIPVVTKGNNESEEKSFVVTKGNNDDVTKGNNPLLQKVIRNITDTTYNTTTSSPQVIEMNQEPINQEVKAKKPTEMFKF